MTAEAGGLAERCILVVEDDYFLAQDLSQALERKGATVVGPVGSVEQALPLLDSQPSLDGAILDVNLGGDAKVYPLAEALRRRGIPFAFATGYDRSHLRWDFADTPLLGKPFNSGHLGPALFR